MRAVLRCGLCAVMHAVMCAVSCVLCCALCCVCCDACCVVRCVVCAVAGECCVLTNAADIVRQVGVVTGGVLVLGESISLFKVSFHTQYPQSFPRHAPNSVPHYVTMSHTSFACVGSPLLVHNLVGWL